MTKIKLMEPAIRYVGGKTYNTQTADIVAHGSCLGGYRRDHLGHSQILYKTKKGKFFIFYETSWDDELDPASFLTPFVESLKQGATVLDIGCGSGRDLLWLKKRGFKVIGFERSPGLASLARKNADCEVIEGDFETYVFSNIQADALLLAGSLVHVEPDRLANLLENITPTLQKPEGFRVPGDGISAPLQRGV